MAERSITHFDCSRCRVRKERKWVGATLTALYFTKGQYEDHGSYTLCSSCTLLLDKFIQQGA